MTALYIYSDTSSRESQSNSPAKTRLTGPVRVTPAKPSAGARLSLYAALVRAHRGHVGLAVCHEIDVRAVRGELLVVPHGAPFALDIDPREVLDRDDLVRNAGDDEILAHVLRRRNGDAHKARLEYLRLDIARRSLEAHGVGLRSTYLARKGSHAPRAVPAKVGLGPVRIEEAHPEVGAVRLLDEDNALASDAVGTRRERRDPAVVFYGERPRHVVDEDKVVARAVHLDERYHLHFKTP